MDEPTARDWLEDAERVKRPCPDCGLGFAGHERRPRCKTCGMTALAKDALAARMRTRDAIAAFASGLKAHLRAVGYHQFASLDEYHGDHSIEFDWPELDAAIDAFAAEFQRGKS